jgi:hypothetical protein
MTVIGSNRHAADIMKLEHSMSLGSRCTEVAFCAGFWTPATRRLRTLN